MAALAVHPGRLLAEPGGRLLALKRAVEVAQHRPTAAAARAAMAVPMGPARRLDVMARGAEAVAVVLPQPLAAMALLGAVACGTLPNA